MLEAFRNSSTMGINVLVSALLPSQQPICRGKPALSTSSPTMTCGSTRLSLEYPTRRRESSFSTSKYKVVTSYRHRDRSPPALTCRRQAA